MLLNGGYEGVISVPVVEAMFRACASGDPPTHGMRLIMAMDLVGGSGTCAQSPWEEMRMRVRMRMRRMRRRVSI